MLLARKLGVAVIVGEDRLAGGLFAEKKFGPQAHLLDDGFQHRRLARDFDIVLVTERDLHDSLLPLGRLREPLTSLSRASAIVLMDNAALDRHPVAESQFVWRASRRVVTPETDEACIAFCGIARPQDFFFELRRAGVILAGTREYADHHAYTAADARSLLRLRRQAGATAFVTTEKDEVNLGDYLVELHPVHVARVRMKFDHSPPPAAAGELATSPEEVLCSLLLRPSENRMRE